MTDRTSNISAMNDLQGFFRPGERERMFEACDNPRDRVLIALLWKSGRRVGEVLQLKVRDIDFENRDIVWNIEKKKRSRRARKPATDWLLKTLGSYIVYAELGLDNFVLESPYKPGHPLSRQRAFQIVREAAKKAGISYVGVKQPHPHHFRHSFAIDLARRARSPAAIRMIQLFLEHSSLKMTEHYLQFGNEDLRELIEPKSKEGSERQMSA